jgi:hypothetical protein
MTAIEHPIISALHAAARATVPYPVDLLAARRADFRAQIQRHTDPVGSCLDDIACQFVTATKEQRDELIAEAAELLTLDPDRCEDIPTGPVSEADDERNSRPFPW